MRIDSATFVKEFMDAYNQGLTSLELATKLGTDPKALYARVYHWRKRGIKLPRLKIGLRGARAEQKSLDVEGINQLIETLTKT